jgi:hypothetical protein
MIFKIGDEVRYKFNKEIGTVTQVNLGRELADCVLVRFTPISDVYCIPRKQLELVSRKI